MDKVEIVKLDEKKDKNPKKKGVFRNKFIFCLRETISVVFWLYLVMKVFVFDIDNYLFQLYLPEFIWILKYKFLILLVLLLGSLILFGGKNLLLWFIYIIFYPFILLFWEIPKKLYEMGSWNIAIAVINVFITFFRNLKYHFLISSFFIISAVLILTTRNIFLVYISIFLIITLLVIIFIDRFVFIFKPTLIYQIHSKIVSKSLDFAKKTWVVDNELKGLSMGEMSEGQLQKWSTNLQFVVVINKVCYFLSSKLKDYQKSNINIFFITLNVIIILIFTIFSFTLINYGLYNIHPDYYIVNVVNHKFFNFFYYSFNAIHFNSISEIIPSSNFSRLLFILEQFFAFVLIGIFLTLFFSTKSQKESSEIDDVVEKIKEQGNQMGIFIQTEYNLSVDDAVNELEKLKAGFIKVIFYLIKNIK